MAATTRERSKLMSTTLDLYPKPTIDSVKALYTALGKPERVEWMSDQAFGEMDGHLVHPVFGLLEHFLSNDSYGPGYTSNPYRGDHLTIPAFSEEGDVLTIEVSFHKGDTIVEKCTFPREPVEVHRALLGLLQTLETR